MIDYFWYFRYIGSFWN